MTQDPRGVLRGRCTICTACFNYTLQPGASDFKCSSCGHPPGKHIKVSPIANEAKSGTYTYQAHGSSYAGAVASPSYSQPSHHASTSTSTYSSNYQSGATGSSYGYSQPRVPPSFNLPECQADGCHSKVHYDRELGPFDYCSPECRDRHLLPKEWEKLKTDIEAFSRQITTLSPLHSDTSPKDSGVHVAIVTVKKKARKPLGVFVYDMHDGELLVTGFERESPIYEKFSEGNIKIFDVITAVNDQLVTNKEEFEKSVWSKTVPDLKFKRTTKMPSIKSFLAEVKSRMLTVTHIFGLDASQVGGGQNLGLKTGFVTGKGLVVTAKSCAYLSGIRDGDIIKMCAAVNKSKLGSPVCFQRLTLIEDDGRNLEKVLKENKPIIIAVKRPL